MLRARSNPYDNQNRAQAVLIKFLSPHNGATPRAEHLVISYIIMSALNKMLHPLRLHYIAIL